MLCRLLPHAGDDYADRCATDVLCGGVVRWCLRKYARTHTHTRSPASNGIARSRAHNGTECVWCIDVDERHLLGIEWR